MIYNPLALTSRVSHLDLALVLALAFALVITPLTLHAQIVGPLVPSGPNPISQNSVSNIGSFGDSLWIGPRLQLNVGGGNDWIRPLGADSVVNGRGRMFSVALAKDTVFAGIGYNVIVDENSVQSGMGFYKSTDGGKNWSFVPFPLDPCKRSGSTDACDNIIIPYGAGSIEALAVIVPQQSPPYDVDFKGNTVFFAGWASGIKRSRDFGQTWERVVLPPTRLSELNPNLAYNFVMNPRPPARTDPNPTDYLNFNAFSVFVDRDGNVWAGTAGGINISDNALTASADRIRWRHIVSNNSRNGMLGNWVIRIKQDPLTGRVWLTNWVGGLQGERFGIVSTANQGLTFEQHLVGEKIYDIAFDGNTIYAAGDNGLFITRDNGSTWEQVRQIVSANARLKSGAVFYSVSKAGNTLWIGTSDGVASTSDGGQTWSITRVNLLPGEGNVFQQESPDVNTYAYPNPFSHRQHRELRIVFDVPQSGNTTIRIYDFGMNLVRELDSRNLPAGPHEAVWDGYDAMGRKVANGAYFYRVSMNGSTANGKILVLE